MATARPIPEEAPVINIFFPSSEYGLYIFDTPYKYLSLSEIIFPPRLWPDG